MTMLDLEYKAQQTDRILGFRAEDIRVGGFRAGDRLSPPGTAPEGTVASRDYSLWERGVPEPPRLVPLCPKVSPVGPPASA